MTLTEGQAETLEFVKDNLQIESKRAILTEWEISFISDQLERFEKYGTDTHFSAKQWNIIEKVEKAFQDGRSTQRR